LVDCPYPDWQCGVCQRLTVGSKCPIGLPGMEPRCEGEMICATDWPRPNDVEDQTGVCRLEEEHAADSRARGGTWGRWGSLFWWYACAIPFRDGGKRCEDARECESKYCMRSDDGRFRCVKSLPEIFGCHYYLSNGGDIESQCDE